MKELEEAVKIWRYVIIRLRERGQNFIQKIKVLKADKLAGFAVHGSTLTLQPHEPLVPRKVSTNHLSSKPALPVHELDCLSRAVILNKLLSYSKLNWVSGMSSIMEFRLMNIIFSTIKTNFILLN